MLALTAVLIRSRRNLGASLLQERAGRERAGVGGASFLGLAWRLQLSTLIGWCVGAAVMGGIAGGLGPVVNDAVSGNDSLRELIGRLVPGSRAEIIDLFTAALLGMAGVLAAAAGVQAVLRLRAEEVEGRAELLFAAPLPRARWLGANLVFAAASVAVVAAVAGIAATVSLAFSVSGSGQQSILVAAALAHVPAATVFVSATAVAFAVLPRLSIPLGWGMLVGGLVLGQFGELMRLPGWFQDLSPFRHSAAMPVEAFDPASAALMSLIALAGAGIAAFLIGRRDLTG